MCFVLFVLVFAEEIMFRLLPALFILAITRNVIFLGVVLVISAFVDAYIHKVDIEDILEKIHANINHEVLDLYMLFVFCLQLVLAYTFYYVFVHCLVISLATGLACAFITTLIVHFLYDFIIILLSYESLRKETE